MLSVQSHLARFNVFRPDPKMRYASAVSDFLIELAWLCYTAAEKNFTDNPRCPAATQVSQAQHECCIAAICWATRNNWVDAIIEEYLDICEENDISSSVEEGYAYYIKAINELFPVVSGLQSPQFKVKFNERYAISS